MTTDPRARFPRSARVRSRAEYTRVFEGGRRIGDALLGLHWLPGEGPARLGQAVSRKVDRRAVGRNRIKRILRETTRCLLPHLAGGDYVVVARPAAARASHAQIATALERLLHKAGALPALPAPGAGGTMPAAPAPTSPPDPMPDARAGRTCLPE